MQKEGVFVLLKKSDEMVFVLVIYHVVEVRFVYGDQVDENLGALTHEE